LQPKLWRVLLFTAFALNIVPFTRTLQSPLEYMNFINFLTSALQYT
jgi:hypothetical protein